VDTAQGYRIDTTESLRDIPVRFSSVEEYALRVMRGGGSSRSSSAA